MAVTEGKKEPGWAWEGLKTERPKLLVIDNMMVEISRSALC